MALNMLTESALSFLSIGVQPPDASWGTIIQDGQGLLYSRPMVALAPGIAIALTVLGLNVLGDGVRDALDPRAKLQDRPPVMLRFLVRRLVPMVFVMFGISVLVFLIFFATPGVDPAARIAGRNAIAGDARRGAAGFRPRPAAAGAVRADDEEAVHHPRPHLVRQPRRRRSSRRSSGGAGDALAGHRRRHALGGRRHRRWGSLAAATRGTCVDRLLMVLGLIGISMPVFWLGEVVNLITQSRLHDTWLFSWVPPLGYKPLPEDPWRWFKT